MKIGKSKSLIGLAIVVLLVGVFCIFLAQQAQTEKPKDAVPSTAATPSEALPTVVTSPGTPPGPPDKPPPPEHQLPSVVLTSDISPERRAEPEIDWETSKVAPVRTYNFTPSASPKALLTEDFEGGVVPPAGWTADTLNSSYTWEVTTTAYEGSYGAKVGWNYNSDEWLISPAIDLTSKGEAWHLYFYWMTSYYWMVDPYDNGEYEVWISTDGGVTFPTKLWCEDDVVGGFSSFTWYKADVDLAGYLTYNNVKFAWRYVADDASDVHLDFVSVDTEPIGRCCYGPDPYNPLCADVIESECNTLGGTWDEGLNCTDNPCPIPTPGDNCEAPIVASLNKAEGDTLYMDLGQTTCGRVDDYDATCLGSYDGGEDIIYELTVNTLVRVNITLDPKTTTYTGIAIDSVCPPGSPCMAYSTSSSAVPHGMDNVDLAPGTYYIMIDTWPSPDCIDSFDLVITEASMAPPNDDCEDAIMLYPPVCPDEQVVDGTTIGAGIDCPGFLDWPAVWYTFELTYECNDLFIDFCEMDIDLSSVGAVIYNECPVECEDPIYMTEGAYVDCPNGTYNAQIWYKNLPPGQYWLPIYVKDLNDNEYLDFSFGICVEECEPLGPGNTCEDPIVVNLNKGPGDTLYLDQNQTTCGRVDDYDATCLGSYDGGEDIIYQVNVTTAVDVDIKMDPKGTGWTGLAIDVDCPPGDPCMAFSTGSSGSRLLPGVHLEPGVYYIMVDTWPSPDCIPDFDLVITEAAGGPPNDSCVNATAIGDVLELPFSTTAATFDGPGHCLDSPNIWYCYTAPCEGNVTVSLCGSEYDTKLAVYDGCVCYPEYGDMMGCNDDYCGLQSQITITGVLPGEEYLIEVGGYSDNTGDGVLTCSCYVPEEAPENDECTGAIAISPPECPATLVVDGTTIGATIDCPGVLDWPAVWYTFELTSASSNVFIDFCEMDFDLYSVGAVMFDECPPDCNNPIYFTEGAFVDCPNGTNNAQIWYKNLPPGQYWLPIYVQDWDGNEYMDFSFGICIEEAIPCTVVCPPNGIAEQEPVCEDNWEDIWNGGCNSPPDYPFEDINCGDTICGTSGTYDYYGADYRDTDWFRVQVSAGYLTWTCVAEFPLLIFVIDAGSGNCVDYTILGYITAGECDTATLSYYVSSGVYWLWVGPSVFSGIPCGKKYVAWADCLPFGPQIAITPASFDPVLNPTGACSTETDTLFISSVGGEDLEYEVSEDPEVAWMEVSSAKQSGTIPPGETDTLIVTFDAGGMAEGDYYADLVVASNAAKQLPDTQLVPVHLKVELAPEIDVPPRLWMPVVPGCMMDHGFRVNNYGKGELRFEVSVQQNPPPLMAAGKGNIREALEALRQAGKANPSLTPKEAFRTIGAKKSTVKYNSTGTSEGLLLSAGAGKQANILLVDDDGGLPGGSYTDIEYAYIDALDANGYVYDYYVVDWTDPESPGPDLATMEQYGGVIWFTGETWGYYGDDTFTPTDEANVGAYLDGGGNLFLSAQDYLYDMYPSAGSFSSGQFPFDYLHLSSVSQDAINDPYTATGGAGSVADGMQFDALRCYDNPDVPLWTDYLYGQTGAVDVFNVPGGVSAVQYDGGNFKTVFTTTEFCGLVDGASRSTKAELMASIMEWFGCVGPVCPFTVYPDEGNIPAESFFDVTLTFDGNLFTECIDDTMTCYLVFTTNDCDEPVVTVDVHAMSARGDVTKNCVINIEDLVFLLNHVFLDPPGPAPDPLCMGDLTRDDPVNVDSDDALYLAAYLFTGGSPPEIPTAPMEDQTPIQLK